MHLLLLLRLFYSSVKKPFKITKQDGIALTLTLQDPGFYYCLEKMWKG